MGSMHSPEAPPRPDNTFYAYKGRDVNSFLPQSNRKMTLNRQSNDHAIVD